MKITYGLSHFLFTLLFLISGSILLGQQTGTAVSDDGKFRITKTSSVSSVPSSGGWVTYTYTVTNLSNDRQYYVSRSDDKCSPMDYQDGMVRFYSLSARRYLSYLNPGATATWECSEYISQTTTNTVTFRFADSFTVGRRGRDFRWQGTSTAQTAVTVTRDLPQGTDCNTLWYSGDYWSGRNAYGKVGTLNLNGYTTEVFDIEDETRDSNKTGSAAMAIDPMNPNQVYFIPRNSLNSSVSYGGLYRYNRQTDQTESLSSFPSGNNSHYVRLGVDPNGLVWTINTSGNARSFNPANNQWTNRGNIDLPSNYSWNTLQSGDLTFDGNGTMYIVASVPEGGNIRGFLFTLTQQQLLSGEPEATLVGRMGDREFNGIAFTEDGKLWASVWLDSTYPYSSYLYEVNIATGLADNRRDIQGASVSDLGSCALPMADIDLQKTVSPLEGVTTGSEITYTITACNTGTLASTNTYFKDLIPAGSTYVRGSTFLNGTAVSDINGNMPYVTNRLINSPNAGEGRIDAGACATIVFKVRIDHTSGDICNQAELYFTGSNGLLLSDDPEASGGTDFTCVTVTPQPPVLTIDKTSLPQHALMAGDTITYHIAVQNTGNVEAQRVEIGDVLPDGVTYVPNSAYKYYFVDGTTAGSRIAEENAANAPQYLIAADEDIDLHPGETIEITLQATVNEGLAVNTLLLNTASVQSLGMDTPLYDDAENITAGFYNISGTVFYDTNGLNNNTVDGIPFCPQPELFAVLVDDNGNVVAQDIVKGRYEPNAGQYEFTNVPSGRNYHVILSETSRSAGSLLDTATLPPHYFHTGENIGSGPGSDGSVDGKSAIFLLDDADVTEVNFGLMFFKPNTEA